MTDVRVAAERTCQRNAGKSGAVLMKIRDGASFALS